MNDCRRILILAATLLIAATGLAWAEQTQSSPPQQTTSFWSWLFNTSPAVAPKPRPAPAARLNSAPEAAKPRPNCTLLNCITLVGIGF